MLQKILPIIKKYKSTIIIISLLTLISLFINFSVSDPTLWGRKLPDTNSYIILGEAFAEGDFIKSSRTPGYPILIAIFKLLDIDYRYISPLQLALNALSPALVFLILKQFKIKSWYSIPAALVVMVDYHIINYSNTLLTEGVAIPQLLIFLLLVILWAKNLTNIPLLISNILVGISLFYTRPIYYLLPISIYILMMIYALIDSKIGLDRKKIVRNILFAITICSTAILFWTCVTYKSSGVVAFSAITVRSKLGVYLKSGYIRDYEIKDDEPEYFKALVTEQQTNPRGTPHKLLFAMEDLGYKLSDKEIETVDKLLIKNNQIDNIFRSTRRGFTMLLDTERKWRGGEPKYEWVEEIIKGLDYYLFIPITSLSTVLVIGGFSYLFTLLSRKEKDFSKILIFSIFLWTIVYTIGVIGFAGYSDFGRLKLPIEPLLIILAFMCMNWTIEITRELFSLVIKGLKINN